MADSTSQGMEDGADVGEEDALVFRRTRASWGAGHTINAGLPERLPDWLQQWSQVVRYDRPARSGKARGPRQRVDWRRTLKRWARMGHQDGQLIWRREPARQGRVVVLWDISGSMAAYVGWYYPWLYRLVSLSADVQVFGFGTAIENLTPFMNASYRASVRTLYEKTSGWGSGTAMGQVFETFVAEHGGQLLSPRTKVVIISDGWDVGDPERLGRSLREMASRTESILWINPLMVTTGFEPRTRALVMARHYARKMVAGADRRSLTRLAFEWGVI